MTGVMLDAMLNKRCYRWVLLGIVLLFRVLPAQAMACSDTNTSQWVIRQQQYKLFNAFSRHLSAYADAKVGLYRTILPNERRHYHDSIIQSEQRIYADLQLAQFYYPDEVVREARRYIGDRSKRLNQWNYASHPAPNQSNQNKLTQQLAHWQQRILMQLWKAIQTDRNNTKSDIHGTAVV